MEQEMAISLTIPWILLAGGVLLALFHLRKQEKIKAKARAAARRQHDPGAFRKLDREPTPKTNANDDDEPDQLS